MRLPTLFLVATLASCSPSPELEAASNEYFTAEQIARHDAYVRPLYARFWIGRVWGFVFIGLFLGLRLNARLLASCDRASCRLAAWAGGVAVLSRVGRAMTRLWGDASWGGALLFVAGFVAIVTLVDLPEAFYFDWLREREQGLSVRSLGGWWWDELKSFVVSTLALATLTFGLYGLARRLHRWWLWLGLPASLLLLVAGFLDPYRVQIHRDYEPLRAGPERAAIEAVLRRANVEHEAVLVLKMREVTRRGNAFVAGQGPSRRIVLWDTLVERMTPEELGNAVAHEIGHLHDGRDKRLLAAAASLTPILAFIAFTLRRLGRRGRWGFSGDADVASLPAALFLFGLVQMTAAPASNAMNRQLEREADQYALTLLEQPEAFRSMQLKLGLMNRADLHPPRWARWLLAAHPHPAERARAAEAFARQKGAPLPRWQPLEAMR